MRFIPFIAVICVAALAHAQEAPADPLVNFPAEAITQAEQPGVPDAPGSPDQPPPPEAPKSPPQSVDAMPENWPPNTVPVFLLACTQGNRQLITPCRCVIDNLMQSMTHREFMKASMENAIDKDPRYATARQQCAIKTQAKPKKQ